MNAVRRLFLIVYSLVLLAALGGIGALAWNQDQKLDLDVGDANFQGFISASDNAKYLLTAVLVALGIIALISLLIAVLPERKGKRSAMRIKQSDGGYVEVTPVAIENVLREELEALPEVRKADPRVSLSGGAIDTFVAAEIEPSSSIAHATRLVGTTVENTLRDHVGVTAVRRPTIRITYDEAAARPIPSRGPRPAPQHTAVREGDDSEFKHAVYPDDSHNDGNRPPEAPRFVPAGEETKAHDPG